MIKRTALTGNRQQATGNRQQATGNYAPDLHFVKYLIDNNLHFYQNRAFRQKNTPKTQEYAPNSKVFKAYSLEAVPNSKEYDSNSLEYKTDSLEYDFNSSEYNSNSIETYLVGRHELGVKIIYTTGNPSDTANKGFRIWYSLIAQGETPPTKPDDLRKSFYTKRKKDVIPFDFDDSGKTAYFAVQIENEGKKGPWGPLVNALIP
jgi:hypothetical protein